MVVTFASRLGQAKWSQKCKILSGLECKQTHKDKPESVSQGKQAPAYASSVPSLLPFLSPDGVLPNPIVSIFCRAHHQHSVSCSWRRPSPSWLSWSAQQRAVHPCTFVNQKPTVLSLIVSWWLEGRTLSVRCISWMRIPGFMDT